MDPVHDTPEIGQPVLDRGARHGDAEIGIHAFEGVGDASAGRFDLLRFVGQKDREPHRSKVAIIVSQGLVGGQYPVGRAQAGPVEAWNAIGIDGSQRTQSGTIGGKTIAQAHA